MLLGQLRLFSIGSYLFKGSNKTLINISRRSLFNFKLDEGISKLKSEQKYILLKTIEATPREVYNVVSEVNKYKEFIPYCLDSFVEKRDSNSSKPTLAGLRIGFNQYDEKFGCTVNCQELKKEEYFVVEAESTSHNLFKTLSTKWSIISHPRKPNLSQVELVLKFQFHSMLYNSVSSIFANNVTKLGIEAFAKRSVDLKAQEKSKSCV